MNGNSTNPGSQKAKVLKEIFRSERTYTRRDAIAHEYRFGIIEGLKRDL